jgi:hypothetical protein
MAVGSIVGVRTRRPMAWPISIASAALAHAAVLVPLSLLEISQPTATPEVAAAPTATAIAPTATAATATAPTATATPATAPPYPIEPCRIAQEKWPNQGLIEQRFERGDGCRATGRDDLDADGVTDCWVAEYWGGMGMGEWNVVLQLGCAGELLSTSSGWSRDDLIDVISVPADHPDLAVGIASLFHPEEPTTRPSAAMAWLLSTASPTSSPPTTGTGGLAGIVLGPPQRYTPRWERGEPRPSPSQLLVATGATAKAIARARGLPDDEFVADRGGMVLVHSYEIGPFTPAGSCGAFEVWTSYDGVAVVDRARHRWSWIHLRDDLNVVDHEASEIEPESNELRCAGDLVFIPRRSRYHTGHDLVIVAPFLGRWRTVSLPPGGDLRDEAAILEFWDSGVDDIRTIPLAALRDAL